MPIRVLYSDSFVLPLPEGHRFPMEKYVLLRRQVEASGLVSAEDLRLAEPATDEELALVHHPEYLRKVREGTLTPMEIRRMGFPWSRELVERSRRSVGAALAAARSALEYGVAASLSGGTHHAFPDRGEGFCVFNDVAVAARAMQREGRAPRVVILDLDVHQGNGTAAIFRRDPGVFTLSVHGANNYPFRKEPSDLDLDLADGTGDEEFLAAVRKGVEGALSAGPFHLAFYLAGADPFLGDRLGRLGVSKEGLERRDRMVLGACLEAGLPVAVVMSGGYASPIQDTVDIHFATVRIATELASQKRGRIPHPSLQHPETRLP
jgi:acetoin utilization deacetylase AcuC-like enzyme